MAGRASLFLAFLLTQAPSVGARRAVSLIVDSAGRDAVNRAALVALACGEDGVAAGVSFETQEQCEMIYSDAPGLHAVFRHRTIHTPTETWRLVTVDDVQGAYAQLGEASAPGAVVVLAAGSQGVDATAAHAPLMAAGASSVLFVSQQQQQGEGALLLSHLAAVAHVEAPGRHLAQGNGSASTGGGGIVGPNGTVNPPGKIYPPPWQWWVELRSGTRILGTLAFVGSALGLLLLNQATLSDDIVSGGGAAHGAAAAPSGAGGATKTGGEAAKHPVPLPSPLSSPNESPSGSSVGSGGGGSASHSGGGGPGSNGFAHLKVDDPVAAAAENGESSSLLGGPLHASAASPLPAAPSSLPSAGASVSAVTALGEPETEAQASARQRAMVHRLVWTVLPLAVVVGVNVALDRWKLLPLLDKLRGEGTDMFWALGLIAGVLALFFSVRSVERDGEALMCMKQTEEAKGWMMFLFLVYHYGDVTSGEEGGHSGS